MPAKKAKDSASTPSAVITIDAWSFLEAWAAEIRKDTTDQSWEDFLITIWKLNYENNSKPGKGLNDKDAKGCEGHANWTKDTDGQPIQNMMSKRCYAKMTTLKNRVKDKSLRPEMIHKAKANWQSTTTRDTPEETDILKAFGIKISNNG